MPKDFKSGDLVAQQVQRIPRSGIREFFELVQGRKDIISLGVGEPDFVTPWHIREAAIYALERGRTSYTSNLGLPKLREVICRYVEDNFGVRYRISNLLALNAHYAGSYQHNGYWDGERDPNTGLIVNSLLFGTSVRFGDGYVAQFNLIQPLGQKMLSKDSDTFKNGLTFLSTFSFPFMI